MKIGEVSEALVNAMENTDNMEGLELFVADDDGQYYEIDKILFSQATNRIYFILDGDGAIVYDNDIPKVLTEIRRGNTK